MKGIMFNLLQEVVVNERGEAAWDDILSAARADGAYTSLGSYPDAELLRLLVVASPERETSAAVRWFGRVAMPLLARRYPMFFRDHVSTQPFLMTLNRVIHTEVRKIYPGADAPDFEFVVESENQLVLGYQSKRRLCVLAEGLIEGAADYYAERVSIRQTQCMLEGHDRCLLECTFSRPVL